MDLKAKSIDAVLRIDEDQFTTTRHPRYAWHAWQTARRMQVIVPDWVLAFLDREAEQQQRELGRLTTAERYAEALLEMDVAVQAHANRVHIRDVAKQFGVPISVSRRDRPNVTAIARVAATRQGISVNRLLARYRKRRKPARSTKKRTPKV